MDGEGDTSGAASAAGTGVATPESQSQSAAPITAMSIGYTPGQTVVPPKTFDVPETYKDKEWVKNIQKAENPQEEFFKQFENAQSLIGKKSELQIPGKDATPEQVKAFHKQLGVPDDVSGYDIKPVEWTTEDKAIGEYLNASRNDAFMADIKTAAHAAGVTPSQLQALSEAYDKSFAKQHKESLQQQMAKEAEMEKGFDEIATQLFGEAKLSIVNNAQRMMEGLVPNEVKPYLARLDNQSLAVLASVLHGVTRKYVKEDGLGTAGAKTPALSKADIQAEGIRLMSLPAYRDVMHPDHDRINQQVKDNYKKLDTLPR